MGDANFSQIIEESVKLHFERNGVLDEMRSGLHVKVLGMLRGETSKKSGNEALCGNDMKQRGLLQLLNYLVVDYFDWFGFKHTMETFALESGNKSPLKSREKLKLELGNKKYANKDLPILLQMLKKHMKAKDGQVEKVVKPPMKVIKPKTAIKDIPPEGNPNTLQKSPPQPTAPTPVKREKINVIERKAPTTNRLMMRRRRRHKKRCSDGDKSTGGSSSTDGHESSYNSDEFANIPYRYYYREREPPETAYVDGNGEEGPYEGSTQPKMKIMLTANKSKAVKIVDKMDDNRKDHKNDTDDEMDEQPHCSHKDGTSKSINIQNKSQKLVKQMSSELKCPESMIESIQDSTEESEESDAYSDEYV